MKTRKTVLGVIIFLLAFIPRIVFGQSDVVGKITVGYQGWFACPGDGSPINVWWHWSSNWGQAPSPTNQAIYAWPDMREYTNTYQTAYSNLGNGQPAKLFSSYSDQTVDVHFKWMQDNNIDCAALQRFNPNGQEGPTRDAMAQKVKTAAEAHSRKFYIMYDVTGWTNMQSEIKTDWTNKMSALTASSAYARHNGKPVVCIWGFGFNDNNHTWSADVCLDVINWFKAQGCFVMGGVPREWRTGVGGSRPNFINTYHAFNAISPWLIGAFGTISGADDIYNQFIVPDLADCNANGIVYQPCVLPGDLSQHQRLHGDLMWHQFYNAVRAGCPAIYISMFDEYNESNQIAKTAENSSQIPVGSNFIGLDEDGTVCSSDYYLRLTGDGGRMLKGQIALTSVRPTSPTGTNVSVTGVSLSPTSLSINVGQTGQLTATVSPSNATNKTVNWTSNNTSVASVNTSGLVTGVTAGSATITATTSDGNKTATCAVTVTAVAQAPKNGTPWAIPGIIEAEDYDLGGEGVAYHDADAINSGGQYRSDGVDIEVCGEGGYNVGWITAGEWLEYTVNVPATGTYNVDARVASNTATGSFRIEFGGVDKTGTITVPNTGGWQTWQTVSKTGLSLTAGTQVMRVYMIGNDFNINKLTFSSSGNVPVTGVSMSPTTLSLTAGQTGQLTATVSPSNATNKSVNWSSSNTGVATVSTSGLVTGVAAGTATITVTTTDGSKTATCGVTVTAQSQTPINGTPWPIPGVIEAENFDNGGEGVAYHDGTSGNTGGQYRTTENVDIEACSEGGYNVGWITAGEWLEYTVNVPATGTYNVDVRVASGATTGSFRIEFGGVDKTGTITVPNTGGWQTWQTVTKTGLSLTAGTQIMRLYMIGSDFNVNKLTFTSSTNIAVTGVTVNPTALPLTIGQTGQLTATVSPSNATNKSVSWSSSNSGVATVNTSGLVTAVAAGSATITVTTTDGAKTATCAVTVTSCTNAISGLSVSPTTLTIPAGQTSQLTATVLPSNACNKNVAWSSSNTSVATVSTSGLVSGIAAGSATITATTLDGGITSTCAVTVTTPTCTDQQTNVTCYQSSSTITVDGNLTESSWCISNVLRKTAIGTPNNTVTFGVLWTNSYLYVGVKVLDANLYSSQPDVWNADAVEIFTDGGNNKTTSYDANDRQYIVTWNKTTIWGTNTTGVLFAQKNITGGYSVEMAIPWSTIGTTPGNNVQIGFDVANDDDDNGSGRANQGVWNGTSSDYNNPSLFGTLTLSTTLKSATNVETLGSTEVTYMPNPVIDQLSIQFNGNNFNSASVYDLTGRLQFVAAIAPEQKNMNLDFSRLKQGLYLIRLNGNATTKVFNVIKR